jgi:diadenosine tetraphosphate (Ap4A) HIT family hydrolase
MCDEVNGRLEIPGGLLTEDELAIGFHAPPIVGNEQPYLGHLLILPRRHVASWGDLDQHESASVGRFVQRLTAALERVGAKRVYVAVIGDAAAHLHVHLLPRYPETPADVPWHAVNHWDGARRGGPEAITALVGELRAALDSNRDA